MDIDLFVHGVPSGEGFWGKEEDRNYFGQFYDHSSDEVKFFIHVRVLKGRPYCYYNYLVYRSRGSSVANVVGNDGRDGSYFGISLRLEAYCRDVANMYRILDTIYNVYILGNILKEEKSKLKYTIADFSNASAVFDACQTTALQLMQKAFSNESFIGLTKFALNGSSTSICNLYDCTADTVYSQVKQYGGITISPFYPSIKEKSIQKQYEEQIEQIKRQCDSKLRADADMRAKEQNQFNMNLSSSRKEIDRLKTEIYEKTDQIQKLASDNEILRTKVSNLGRAKDLEQIVAPLREPIIKLAGKMQELSPKYRDNGRVVQVKEKDREEKKHSSSYLSLLKKTTSLLPVLNFLLLIALVVLVLFNLPYFNVSKKKVTSYVNTNSMSDTEVQDVNSERDSAWGLQEPQIEIKDYNGKYLEAGKTYLVEITSVNDNPQIINPRGCKISGTENPKQWKMEVKTNEEKVILTLEEGGMKVEKVYDIKK